MYKHVLSTLLSILITLGVYAQNIEGILIDATNNTPIDGGFITLLTSTKNTLRQAIPKRMVNFPFINQAMTACFYPLIQ